MFTWSYLFGKLQYLSREEYIIWRRSMFALLKEYCQVSVINPIIPVIFTFALAKIKVIKRTYDCNKNDPIVILCVKNDLIRIKMLVSHYRKLGIERFAVLDNGSEDGTFEWLSEQEDVDVYRCYDKYQTFVKEGWINRIVSYYGFDRWVILTDSDELIVYEGMETHSIKELVNYGQKNGIKRFKALTLDVYQNGKIFGDSDNIQKDLCWVDSDSYYEKKIKAGKLEIVRFIGGPRHRLMQSTVSLSKYPLLFFEKGTISDNAHYQFPHEEILKAPCNLGILHYKFLDTDLMEFKNRTQEDSGFFNKGLYYKQYINYFMSPEKKDFMYDGSVEFIDSGTLKLIDFIKPINFDA